MGTNIPALVGEQEIIILDEDGTGNEHDKRVKSFVRTIQK